MRRVKVMAKTRHNFDYADENEIRVGLSTRAENIKIKILPEVGSTNDEMRKAAIDGKGEIRVLIAESQTDGKGTKGRTFFSPANSGCYMSFLLRPKYSAEECTLLTTMAAAAVAGAIEKITGEETEIKWINDVYIHRKKVAGILTEAKITKDGKGLEYAIVGIGININAPEGGFPDELEQIAGTVVYGKRAFIKNQLIAEIINRFVEYYHNLPQKKYMSLYRKKLFFLGEEITVVEGEYSYKATAVTVDSMSRLIVTLEDGSEKTLFGGEISIKPQKLRR